MELSITEDAAQEFKKSIEGIEPEPYLRIGAKKGGCSGGTFTLETDEDIDPYKHIITFSNSKLIIKKSFFLKKKNLN